MHAYIHRAPTYTRTTQILLDTGVFGGVSDSELDSWLCALPCSWAARETQAAVECLDDAVRAVSQDPYVAFDRVAVAAAHARAVCLVCLCVVDVRFNEQFP